MYYIDSKVENPDAAYLKLKIEQAVQVRGVRLSNDIFKLRNELTVDKEDNLTYFQNKYGVKNPNSPKQLVSWMEDNFTDEELEVCTLNDGKISTKGELLVDLAHAGNEFAVDLLTYRRVTKRLEYVNLMLQCCDKYGVVKPEVSLGNTNRINYKNPPLMNIPKGILWNVISPYKDGNVLISVDIKNQEPWILINWLGIPELKEMIKSNPKGLYNAIYKKVYGSDPSEIQRKECKTAWNALTYGATRFGLNRICKNIDGDSIYDYFNKIKELKEYRSKCYAHATNKVRKTKTYFGTELHPDAQFKGMLQRQLMDFPIQGTGSDILSLLVAHVDDELAMKKLEDKIELYYSRHDEIIFEVDGKFFKEKGEDYVINLIRDLTEHQVDNWEPFQLEIGVVERSTLNNLEEDEDEEM